LAFPSEFDRICVVLVAPRNPLNVGAAARAMSNFGCRDLRVVNPYEVAFREARSAVGAPALLASAAEYKSLAEAVADCTLVVGTTAGRHREIQHALHLLPDGIKRIRKHLPASKKSDRRTALLFGSEKRGLSNSDFSHCHWLLRIPTRVDHVSMNLGQAVAVCLYEFTRNAQPEAKPVKSKTAPPELSTAGEVERITVMLLNALHISGYLPAQSSAAAEDKVRRLVRRLKLADADAELWLGMLRQILWKLQAAK
jgi:TrmH family RNA methyltransferase